MKTRKNSLPHIECLTLADLQAAVLANVHGPAEYLALVDAEDRGWLVTWNEDLYPFAVSYTIGDADGDPDSQGKTRLLEDLLFPVVLINTVVDRCNTLGGGAFGAPVRCVRLLHGGQHLSVSGTRW